VTGTLHLVGVGPGDPDLLTLKAARLLGAMPVIAFPTTGEGAALARDIAAAHLNPAAILLPVAIPMSVERAPAQAAYDGAAQAIAAHLAAGRDVAWLCEGDPLFYGSAMYLVSRLAPVAPIVSDPRHHFAHRRRRCHRPPARCPQRAPQDPARPAFR